MIYKTFILFLLLLLYTDNIKAASKKKDITINIIGSSILTFGDIYHALIDDWEKHKKEYDLEHVKLDMTVFSSENITFDIADYESVIDSLLMKNTVKYDIFTYDPLYIEKYSSNFMDVKDLVPKEHLDLYRFGDAQKTCVNSKNEWIGLPFFQKYTSLFSNKPLLDKYNKPVPETWEELLETGKYIQQQERDLYNNTDFIIFNGMYTNLNAIPTVYEFIYSYRDDIDGGFPGFDSEAAVEAIKMYKRLKEEISSDDIYHVSEPFIIGSIKAGEGLFIIIWDTPNDNQHEKFYMTTIPGKKRGMHTALTTSVNLGVNKYISDERKEVALKVLEYMTSERVQKEIVVKQFKLNTGITKLYDDEEVCEILICPMVKGAKTIHREFKYVEPSKMLSYCNKIYDLFTQCIFGDKSVEDALAEIVNITKIYHVTLDSTIGLVTFIVLIVVTLIMTVFLMIPLFEYFDGYYSFFSWDLWLVYTIGYYMMISTPYLSIGSYTDLKCNLRFTLVFTGIFLWNIMILYKLLTCFPEKNKYSQYLVSHKFEFILLTIGMAVVINLLYLLSPFSVEKQMFEVTKQHKNFEKCTMQSIFGNIWTLINVIINGFIILVIFLFSFIEWNVKEIYEDIRSIVINEYLSVFTIILLVILDYLNINNYDIIFIIHTAIIVTLCIPNYYFIYTLRLLFSESNEIEKIIFNISGNNNKSSKTVTLNSTGNSTSILSKILSYHYVRYSVEEQCVISSQFTSPHGTSNYGNSKRDNYDFTSSFRSNRRESFNYTNRRESRSYSTGRRESCASYTSSPASHNATNNNLVINNNPNT